jgi:hypothetical protein
MVDARELAIAEMEILRIVTHYTIPMLVRKSLEMANKPALSRPPGVPPADGVSCRT